MAADSAPVEPRPIDEVTREDKAWVRSEEDRALAEDEVSVVTDAELRASAIQGSSSRVVIWSPEMDTPIAVSPPIRLVDDTVVREATWQAEGDSPLQPLTPPVGRPPYPAKLTARAPVPQPVVSLHREPCPHCGGTGFMPGISDYLRESIGLLADGDRAVRTFYGMLFREDPGLVKLFPGDPREGDLGTDHRGARQREKLLQALIALADLYDPDDPDKVARLDTALGAFGRSHAAFARPDGTVRGATWEEYAAVKAALFGTFVQEAAGAWRSEFTESWSQAYDYAAAVMTVEQYRSGFSSPRFPRA
jgi:hemoglobin-like flavoprotein